ncbi:MAG: dimethylsulfonioproprionate lyase family protein [Pseudomonadota bacterium]
MTDAAPNAFDGVRRALSAHLSKGDGLTQEEDLAPFLAALKGPNITPGPTAAPIEDPQIRDGLRTALNTLAGPEDLQRAIRDAAPHIAWYRMLEGAPISEDLRRGLVVGPLARAEDPPLILGLFLLAAGLHYPLHQHAAAEVYAPLSGSLRIRHGLTGDPIHIPAGRWSITPPHRLHSMDIGSAPCLLLYVWTGEITAPGYWWDRDPDGTWHRARWERAPDGMWHQVSRERVGEDALKAADPNTAHFPA